MSTHGDFIDYRVIQRVLYTNPEKGDFAPSSEVTRKKVTFGPIWKSHTRINVAFGRALTRKKVALGVAQPGKRWLWTRKKVALDLR